MIKYGLGIDISKSSFYVCISSIDAVQRTKIVATTSFSNNKEGFKKLSEWIKKHRKNTEIPMLVTMEATGVYYEQCAMYLYNNCFDIAVVLPNRAKKYLQSLGLKSKNDKIDAKGLSYMAAQQSLELWQPLDDFYYQLRDMTRQYQSLQELKTQVGNQLHAQEHSAFVSKIVVKQIKKQIALLDKLIVEITKQIELHIKNKKEVAEKVSRICEIKGVGVLTVAVILAETNGFILFKNQRQLVSYAGYDIVENQSGKHNGKTKMSKKGNSRIRRALYMPALNVVRYGVKSFVNLYERTFDKHKIKMKSYVAIQKKLLVLIYTLWKNDDVFQEDYQNDKILIQEQEQVLPLNSALKEPQKNSPEYSGLHKVSIQ